MTNSAIPSDAVVHFVFVDFENVPDVDLDLIAGRPVRVTLLIGKNQKKLDLPLVRQIHRLATQVDIVEVGASGHNALDLTLACYLGQSIQQQPAAKFHIVSRDQDFDPMIAHLLARGVKVGRCGGFHLLPFLPRAKPIGPVKSPASARVTAAPKKPAVDKRAKELARLRDPATPNRPHTEKSLRAHIKTALGKESSPAKVEEMFAELRNGNEFTVGLDGHIVWAIR